MGENTHVMLGVDQISTKSETRNFPPFPVPEKVDFSPLVQEMRHSLGVLDDRLGAVFKLLGERSSHAPTSVTIPHLDRLVAVFEEIHGALADATERAREREAEKPRVLPTTYQAEALAEMTLERVAIEEIAKALKVEKTFQFPTLNLQGHLEDTKLARAAFAISVTQTAVLLAILIHTLWPVVSR